MMRIFIFLALFLLTFQAQALIQVQMKLNPDPPQEGSNALSLQLQEDGIPLKKAKISARITMPAMGSMPKMESKAEVTEKGDGKYLVHFEIPMDATWEMELQIQSEKESQNFFYSITTGIPGVKDNNAPQNNNKNSEKMESKNTAKTTTLNIGVDRLQKIGVRFAIAQRRNLSTLIHSVGIVEADKTKSAEVTLRFSGYLEKQFVGKIGDYVKAGEPLSTIYSPDLYAAENEFLISHENLRHDKNLSKLSASKLLTLGLSTDEINKIKKTKTPQRTYVLRSPITGTILEIKAREGAAVNTGEILYVIGNLEKTYIVAKVFQQDISGVHTKQEVKITSSVDKSMSTIGYVDLIYPNVTEGSGTQDVRIAFAPSSSFILQPGIYVDVEFVVELSEKLSVPTESILYSGLHNYVFVDKENGILEPREVIVGKHTNDYTEIMSGLQENEKIAQSGQFLLSAEAQLRSALPKWKQQQ